MPKGIIDVLGGMLVPQGVTVLRTASEITHMPKPAINWGNASLAAMNFGEDLGGLPVLQCSISVGCIARSWAEHLSTPSLAGRKNTA